MTPEETLSRNLRLAVSKDVGLAGILLYVPAVLAADAEHIAWTDGRKMYFADSYFACPPDEQVGIVIHEALHVALRHVQRGEVLRLREGPGYDARRWNIACDAIVNHSIGGCRWCKLPAGAWYPENCIDQAKLRERPAELWTAEEIYRELGNPEKKLGKLLTGAGSLSGLDLFGSSETRVRSGDGHDERMEQGIWRERLVRAQAGSAPGSILRRLAADVPKPQVRWESVLRDFLIARLMPLTETAWNRPSRRTLAMGRDACWIEPGTSRRAGIRRAGVVIDTSGSIDERLLAVFLAEINSLIVITGCEVVLIDCDAQVQQVSTHRMPIRGYTPKGGGGTDFRPAIEALRRAVPDVAVYFTDLMGTYPEKRPGFPLLWLATCDLAVPFGRKVLLPRHGGV
ncbi:MAG: VWA-like domain-containing protein [Acidobacteriaceae bacterium]